ncbi:MAG: glycoside hydrolase family 73 protein [Bacteroidota bacterium]
MSGRILALATELGSYRVKRTPSRALSTLRRRQPYGWMFTTLPEVHLANNSGAAITRASGSKARKLNESGQPAMRSGATAIADPAFITSVINWLDVQHSQRYQPTPSSTYCNIYAYDFACFMGVYIPRVWWNSSITSPTASQIANPRYETEVHEMNANAIYEWFIAHGGNFGWVEATPNGDFTTLQNQANAGHIVIIVYKNNSGSGHICPIVPEIDTQRAVRSGTTVTRPLQSQAGRNNYKYHTNNWWGSNTQVKYWVKTLPAGAAITPTPVPSSTTTTPTPSTSGSESNLGGTIGGVAGGVIGGIAAGPAGAIIGSQVGQRIGNWVGSQSYDDQFEGKNFNYQDDVDLSYGSGYVQQFTIQDDFIAAYSQMAIDSMRQTQVPASVTLAQAALESGWGRHAPGNNFFGIKAGRNWTGQRQLLRTREVHADDDRSRHPYPEVISITRRSDGRFEWVVRDHFRAYASALESFNDHGNLLRNASRYRAAFQHTSDGIQFAQEIARAGYATAPNYAAQLTSLINQYNLTRFDRP